MRRKKKITKDYKTEVIDTSMDRHIGENAAGERLFERHDLSRYRMHYGRPDFGGDLAPIENRVNQNG